MGFLFLSKVLGFTKLSYQIMLYTCSIHFPDLLTKLIESVFRYFRSLFLSHKLKAKRTILLNSKMKINCMSLSSKIQTFCRNVGCILLKLVFRSHQYDTLRLINSIRSFALPCLIFSQFLKASNYYPTIYQQHFTKVLLSNLKSVS